MQKGHESATTEKRIQSGMEQIHILIEYWKFFSDWMEEFSRLLEIILRRALSECP